MRENRLAEELEQCRRDLAKAQTVRRDFLCNMSHELRTPLNGVLGMADILLDTPLSGDQRFYVETLRSSGRDLLQIINNLLDLSTAQQGELGFKARDFRLAPALETVLEPLRVKAASKHLEFIVEYDKDLPDVLRGDPDRLRQIVFNLVDNAVKFTEAGAVRLCVRRDKLRSENEPEGDVVVVIVVEDNGPGVAADMLPGLFEPACIGEEYLTKKKAGAGLGLAVVRSLVERMRGSVEHKPRSGGGAVFIAKMRLWAVDREHPAAQRKARILLVEDEPVSALYTELMLQKLGHEVVRAVHGLNALQYLSAEDFDCVFMDMQMPVMDGMTAFKAIRTGDGAFKPRDADIPVAALTVFAQPEETQRILDAGFLLHLTKPVDIAALGEAVEAMLAGKGMR